MVFMKERNIDYTKPMIALTFDDGPTNKYTNQILDILEEYNAAATFFVLGNKVEKNASTLQRMVLQGCEIGNHSYSHKQLSNLSKEKLQYEIEQTNTAVNNVIGIKPNYLRPTYGSVNRFIRKNTDMKIVLWTIDSKDWKYRNKDTIAERVLKDIEDGDIILMHDIYKSTVEAVRILVPELIHRGYQLVTVSELKKFQ